MTVSCEADRDGRVGTFDELLAAGGEGFRVWDVGLEAASRYDLSEAEVVGAQDTAPVDTLLEPL